MHQFSRNLCEIYGLIFSAYFKWHVFMFQHKDSFYGEELSEPVRTPKLEDHTLSAVCDC